MIKLLKNERTMKNNYATSIRSSVTWYENRERRSGNEGSFKIILFNNRVVTNGKLTPEITALRKASLSSMDWSNRIIIRINAPST